jgi:hypothetical protein
VRSQRLDPALSITELYIRVATVSALAENESSFRANAANHLSLIRSFLIDSGHSRPSRKASCVNFFCAALALDRIGIEVKQNARSRDFPSLHCVRSVATVELKNLISSHYLQR